MGAGTKRKIIFTKWRIKAGGEEKSIKGFEGQKRECREKEQRREERNMK